MEGAEEDGMRVGKIGLHVALALIAGGLSTSLITGSLPWSEITFTESSRLPFGFPTRSLPSSRSISRAPNSTQVTADVNQTSAPGTAVSPRPSRSSRTTRSAKTESSAPRLGPSVPRGSGRRWGASSDACPLDSRSAADGSAFRLQGEALDGGAPAGWAQEDVQASRSKTSPRKTARAVVIKTSERRIGANIGITASAWGGYRIFRAMAPSEIARM